MAKDIQNELLSKVQELASLSTLTAEELAQKQAKIEQLQKIVEQLQSEIEKLKSGEKNENLKQTNKEDTNNILDKIKSVDRNSAKAILLDTNISRELCFDILDSLNSKANSRAKKETLVEKILDIIFNYENREYYDKLARQLRNVKTREEAKNILKDLNTEDLKKLKATMNISSIGKTKNAIIYAIVQNVIGSKLDAEAIMSVKLK